VSSSAEELVESLLYEGYALYPYTPSATKNATPTPFGIVYPARYAEGGPHTFDHAQVQCLARPAEGATLSASVHFLRPSGERHEAAEHRAAIAPQAIGASAATDFAEGRLTLASEVLDDGSVRVTARVENTLPVEQGLERKQALRHALLSTHLLVRLSAGRFVSPLEAEACRNVNTWPVLAGSDDEAVIGACIVLPDHPQIAPESRGNLFDNTEIEEALMLHVHVLSDAEREEIAGADPAVREMIERALATTPKEMIELHGRVRLSDPDDGDELQAARRVLEAALLDADENLAPPSNAARTSGLSGDRAWSLELPPTLVMEPDTGTMAAGPRAWEDPLPAPVFAEPTETGMVAPAPGSTPGEREVEIDGVVHRLGETVVLRPDAERDPYDRALNGRRATIERLYHDYDGRLYIGVTVDDVPEQQLLRETGRYLFFFAGEVEKP
jgi:hypothetical protein